MISSALYRFFGMVQISSRGFLPLSIWTSFFGLGQLNRPFEHIAQIPGGRFLATGYIGMYRSPGE